MHHIRSTFTPQGQAQVQSQVQNSTTQDDHNKSQNQTNNTSSNNENVNRNNDVTGSVSSAVPVPVSVSSIAVIHASQEAMKKVQMLPFTSISHDDADDDDDPPQPSTLLPPKPYQPIDTIQSPYNTHSTLTSVPIIDKNTAVTTGTEKNENDENRSHNMIN
jgi:hypothetical protein